MNADAALETATKIAACLRHRDPLPLCIDGILVSRDNNFVQLEGARELITLQLGREGLSPALTVSDLATRYFLPAVYRLNGD